MKAIPIYVIEEHHEAYLVWHHAIQLEFLPATGNALLHFDEHADMGAPLLRRPIPLPGSSLEEVREFTFQEISIYEFITTAIRQGIFDRVCWIKPQPTLRQEQRIQVAALDADGHALHVRPWPGSGPLASYEIHSVDFDFKPTRPTVLDIDLDYFSCDQAERQAERLEVVESEFLKFSSDPYHFLRINQGNRVQARCEAGRYFLYLKNYEDRPPCPLRMTADVIVERVGRMREFLTRNEIRPAIINIARSRLSGYTPANQWEFIEAQVLDCLGSLYELDRLEMTEPHAQPVGSTDR